MSARTGESRRRRGDERAWGVLGWIYLVVLLLFALLPMIWMVLTSIKTQLSALQYPPEWIPTNVTFEQYQRLLIPRATSAASSCASPGTASGSRRRPR